MYYVHHWPMVAVTVAAAAGIVILAWILMNFIRESRPPKNDTPPLGSPRDPRR